MAGAMNSSAMPNSLRPAPGLLFLSGASALGAWTGWQRYLDRFAGHRATSAGWTAAGSGIGRPRPDRGRLGATDVIVGPFDTVDRR